MQLLRIKKCGVRATIILLGLLFLSGALKVAVAQQQSPCSTGIVNANTRRAVVDSLLVELSDYIFLEKAEKMKAALREHMRQGDYEGITDASDFEDLLLKHLHAVSHDMHLDVDFDPRGPEDTEDGGESLTQLERARNRNFGFYTVKRLKGNVGYLEIQSFDFAGKYAKETAAAAMNFLAYTDALIIDLRQNGGGSPQMVAHMVSYFLKPDSILINKLYFRISNDTWMFWSDVQLPGKRYGTKRPVYILTSSYTFSAAEEFAYDLKHLDRATIVGKVTGGGANPVTGRSLPSCFSLSLPIGTAINPITGTNWEGTGVQPDVAVPAERALEVAHLMALKAIAENNAARAKKLQRIIRTLQEKVRDVQSK